MHACMQAIVETGDDSFNPLQWLCPAHTAPSAAGPLNASKDNVPEGGTQHRTATSSINEIQKAEPSSTGSFSALEESALGAAQDTHEVGSSEMGPSSTLSSNEKSSCSAQLFKQKEANSTRQLVFGVGPRSCVGQSLAVAELVTFLIVLAREVQEVKMSAEEQEREMVPLFPHPTGIPAHFILRSC
jgi:hypothetical protein